MTKAKSTSARASTKATKVGSSKGGLKHSKSLATKIGGDVAQQQKKPAVKKMDQAGDVVAATKDISPSTKILAASEAEATEAANSIQSQQRLDRAADASPSTHSNVNHGQNRAVPGNPRAGSKLAIVLGMLREDGGASITAIMQATGWLSHTTRAVLTGLKKRGYVIERQVGEKGSPSIYRIKFEPTVAASMPASPSASKRAA